MRHMLFQAIHVLALMLDRLQQEHEVVRAADILDSQPVKNAAPDKRSYDATKMVKGRKRHIVVKSMRLLSSNLTPVYTADSTRTLMMLDALKQRWPWVKHLFGDAAYERRTLMNKATFLDFTVEVARGLREWQGFDVQPRRWVVERSFAWPLRWRRLVRDYEQWLDVSQNMITIAMGPLLLHRMCCCPSLFLFQ